MRHIQRKPALSRPPDLPTRRESWWTRPEAQADRDAFRAARDAQQAWLDAYKHLVPYRWPEA